MDVTRSDLHRIRAEFTEKLNPMLTERRYHKVDIVLVTAALQFDEIIFGQFVATEHIVLTFAG